MIHLTGLARIRETAILLSLTSVASALPAKAMTLAGSQGSFSFSNFSIAPVSTDSSATTFTNTVGSDSGTIAIADADAIFTTLPNAGASNFIANSVFSSTLPSSALARSEASIIGNFEIAANQVFDFDFLSNIDLFTSIDRPTDLAAASLDIQYSLFAFDPATSTLNELDFFTLAGNISTPNGADGFSIDNSSAIALTLANIAHNTGARQTTEDISGQVAGSYRRLFDRSATLTLAEVKAGTATVETQAVAVPAPDIIWGIGAFAAIAFAKRKRLSRKSK